MRSQEQRDVAELEGMRGWQDLKDRARKAQADYYTALARQLHANPARVTDHNLWYKQGFFNGMWWLLNNPYFEAKALERELSKTKDEVNVD